MEIEESIDVTASPVVNAYGSIVCLREEDNTEDDQVAGWQIHMQRGKVFVIRVKNQILYALSHVGVGGERSELCL